MIPKRLNESLAGKYGNYVLPFIWYTGESKNAVAKEIQAVHDAGAREFVFENRAGDWFATDFWWDMFRFVLDTARSLGMRVWSLDDSHVNTGSANDSLGKEENARFRAKNLRMEFMDIASFPTAGAVSLPPRTDNETVIRISAFRLDEQSGETFGEAIDLTGGITDGLCPVDLPGGLWRIYFILTVDPASCGVFQNYITMVSRDSCRHLINEVHEKFYANFSDYFGNTFAGFFSDEPAFGNCDGQYGPYAYKLRPGQTDKMFAWWDDFPEKLAEKLAISPAKVMELLPSLWDGMKDVSSKFRLAYMDLITQLWEENFSRQIGRWCEDHHVEYIGHNLEDGGAHMRSGWGCGHYFRSMSGQHMSGMDLVFEQLMPGITGIEHAMNTHSRKRESAFYHYTLPKMAASLAHQTPGMKNRALSEVFGATGWTCGAFNMHAIFNLCLVSGINHFIPHAFSMNLPDCFASQQQRTAGENSHTPPGYCLRYLPPNFHTGGFNPQFPVFGEIIRCAQRVSHLTYHAVHQPDAAIYYNAECDWMNNGTYQNLDDVTMTLARSGYDYDIVPLDALKNAELTADGTFCVNGEKFRTLIIPGAEILPEKLLAVCREFSGHGINILFAGNLPERSENGTADTAGFTAYPLNRLIPALQQIAPPGFDLAVPCPELRRLRLRDEENRELLVLFNSGIKEISFTLPAGMIYDPWKNRLYRYTGNQPVSMTIQQLLIFYPGISGTEELPEFPARPENLRALPLKYRISIKEAGDREFRLLRENSLPVDLFTGEKLWRTCAEFKYETEFDYSGENAAVLEISRAGDAAELIINGRSCGFALGTVCRFDIRGMLKKGRNRLEIHTFDNPAYIDRKENKSIGYGAWFPLMPHGFTGDILIG